MKKGFLLFSSLCLLAACTDQPGRSAAGTSYFDLQSYFKQEATRLNQARPLVEKTVMVNGEEEKKKLNIPDWQNELSVFADADINKSAWKGAFKVSKMTDGDIYATDEDKIPVKEVRVFKKDNKITGIRIFMRTENYLYNSLDTLAYYPDSTYQISKVQHIRLLNKKAYKITGKF